MRRIVAVAVAAVVASCGPLPAPVSPATSAECEAAGARLRELGCHEAYTPLGTPFATFCDRQSRAGARIPASCIASAESCEVARECH
jgi:hypothetical protein